MERKGIKTKRRTITKHRDTKGNIHACFLVKTNSSFFLVALCLIDAIRSVIKNEIKC